MKVLIGKHEQFGSSTLVEVIWLLTVTGIWCHKSNNVTYPILRCMLGYNVDYQLHHKYHLMKLDVQVRLLIYWHECVQ
jgi:hypothetical protein